MNSGSRKPTRRFLPSHTFTPPTSSHLNKTRQNPRKGSRQPETYSTHSQGNLVASTQTAKIASLWLSISFTNFISRVRPRLCRSCRPLSSRRLSCARRRCLNRNLPLSHTRESVTFTVAGVEILGLGVVGLPDTEGARPRDAIAQSGGSKGKHIGGTPALVWRAGTTPNLVSNLIKAGVSTTYAWLGTGSEEIKSWLVAD